MPFFTILESDDVDNKSFYNLCACLLFYLWLSTMFMNVYLLHQFSDLISTMTGGDAVIESIREFDEKTDADGSSSDLKELNYGSRDGKNVKPDK